jgi:uncharacterized damage-inducible protein DinB
MVKWIDRQFQEKPDAGTFPMVVERMAGTPVRLNEKISAVSPEFLTHRSGDSWTIQEHVGHLADVEELWRVRIDEFLAGEAVLTAADMSNRSTYDAKHNEHAIEELIAAFRASRSKIVSRLETVAAPIVVREARHPRLQRSMRLIDLCCFVAEHDDHHLAKMSELWRALTGNPAVLSLVSPPG